MRVGYLTTSLKVFASLYNKQAVSQTYRTIELNGRFVYGCASWGLLEVDIERPLFTSVAHLDTLKVLEVLNSLPQNDEIVFTHEPGVVGWACGTARGTFKTVELSAALPVFGKYDMRSAPFIKLDKAAAKAFALGSLSSASHSLAKVGMHGSVIYNIGDGMFIASSDNITASYALMGEKVAGAPDSITIANDAANLLGDLSSSFEGTLYFLNDEDLLFKAPRARLVLKSAAPLSHNLLDLYTAYYTEEAFVSLSNARIKAFAKRAAAIAEQRSGMLVQFAAKAGKIMLSFQEGAAHSEEEYLVEGLNIPDLGPVNLDTERLLRALGHSQRIVLDHVERRILMLRGTNPEFSYLICSKE